MPFADLLKAHMIGRHGDYPIERTYGAEGADIPPTQLFSTDSAAKRATLSATDRDKA